MADFVDYPKLNEAITSESELPIVTKFLVLFEGVSADGDRCLGYMSSDACAVWDELGFMEYHKRYRAAEFASDDD